MNQTNNADIEVLTLEELQLLKRFIKIGAVEIEFQGDDLALTAIHETRKTNLSPEDFDLVADWSTVGKVPLRRAVCASFSFMDGNNLPSDEDEKRQFRDELFAFAGRLREAAQFIENKAARLHDEKWDQGLTGAFEPEDDISATVSIR